MSSGVISAIAAALSALAALFTVKVTLSQVSELRRTMGAETFLRLEEKFYYTNLMRGWRRQAVLELSAGDSFDAFDELGNFFDSVGLLLRQGILDDEMASSSYRRRACAFWDEAYAVGLIERVREIYPVRWDDFEYLVHRLEKFHERKYKRPGKLTPKERAIILSQEKTLPTLEAEQREMWAGAAARGAPLPLNT
jgi:hypothetical protein